ncbi:SIDL trafficking protein particle complex subunit 10 isoform X2 [Oratosquilla oratoria]|uniref:SIDL trafficking protein particle complex subunit 10 isoform X2 n=1 Tax=Oratosquilla oratoria TaxID=337810 RepID=UPI003F76910F
MSRRPIVTYAGDPGLFSGLQAGLVSSLPQESVEWRRSYGRPSRCVHVEVDFVPYSEECILKEIPRSILGQPIFHTFWTDCSDIEAYKNNVKESIQAWLTQLRFYGVTDWMVVLVETPDTKKGNKLLPRTTVLDKIKNDFGGKQAERCVSLIDPLKTDSRSLESWQTLMTKMRHLLMFAYNRALNKFEENMRGERERRTEKSWSFFSYFLLQEELAQVFSSLALYDEALVQYDELDALFTQFVLNSAAGETANWLAAFGQQCDSWEGLYLTPDLDRNIQDKIRSKEATLLEFRNYLFQRQCALLLQLKKPWEIASRALTFLQNTVGELNILEVKVAEGGIACWGFLSCLEVLFMAAQHKDPATLDAHALHTAPLWAYARDKLQELGELCGLMPGGQTTSNQLHTVVSLVTGMGNDPHGHGTEGDSGGADSMTPMTRLKDAVSSQEAFRKHFLDISELAISTYKHIGRIRSARLVGRDLAAFYVRLGEPQKAVSFLTDQLKTFMEEGWETLITHTQTDLTKCYKSIQDNERYIKTCAQLAANSVIGKEQQETYYKEMMDSIDEIPESGCLLVPMDRIFDVTKLEVLTKEQIILDSEVQVQVVLNSRLPKEISCKRICVSLKHWPEENKPTNSGPTKRSGGTEIERKKSTSSNNSKTGPPRAGAQRSTSNSSESERKLSGGCSMEGEGENEGEGVEGQLNTATQALHMTLHLEYKQDKSLSAASVTCSNSHKVLRRRDSQGGLHKVDKSVAKDDLKDSLVLENVTVMPGTNSFTLLTKVTKQGTFSGHQTILVMDKVEFISTACSLQWHQPLTFQVVSEQPRLFLSRKDRDLLAGICQPMILTVHSGSVRISKGTVIKMKTSKGLTAKETSLDTELGRELEVSLPEVLPFSSATIPLTVLADLGPQKDASTVEHCVSITSPFSESRLDIDVHFIPPFMSSHKLHTANTRKFVQINVAGLTSQQIECSDPSFQLLDAEDNILLTPLNNPGQKLVVCSDQNGSFMWEMGVDNSKGNVIPIKGEFCLFYQPLGVNSEPLGEELRWYKCIYEIQDYKTLYTIRARVEPSKGSEFCRAGNMCFLHISIQQLEGQASGTPSGDSIMYEVLADQTMWAVCGRTSGVLTLEAGAKQNVTLDVMPLTGGFLPLPNVRLSKYIPADSKNPTKESSRKADYVGSASSVPRLEPFRAGQVYNFSKAQQVHVLPASNSAPTDISLN